MAGILSEAWTAYFSRTPGFTLLYWRPCYSSFSFQCFVVFLFCFACLRPVSCVPMFCLSSSRVLCPYVLLVFVLCLVSLCFACLRPMSCVPMFCLSSSCVLCPYVLLVFVLCLVSLCFACLCSVSCVPMLPMFLNGPLLIVPTISF